MKVLDIAILNTTAGGEEPIPLVAATDLSSFGYFQRQVRRLILSQVLDACNIATQVERRSTGNWI
jgi:hypothetical protein